MAQTPHSGEPTVPAPERADERADAVIAASFTIDPLIDAAPFWAGALGAPYGLAPAPFAQVFQQLLDPRSSLRKAKGGRIVAFRWRDLLSEDEADAADAARRLCTALADSLDGAPTLVLVCPEESAAGERYAAADAELAALASTAPTLMIAHLHEAFDRYLVGKPFDAVAEAAACLPYSAEAMAVMGAVIARWRAPFLRAPIKLIAVDGDNTLWDGVLGEDGEDGADGVSLSSGKRALQTRLSESAREGVILALLTKNDRTDIDQLFAVRDDFPLNADDFLAIRADWNAKADNLAALAAQYGVGADAILFLDDNPVECAAMAAAFPDAAVIRMPMDSELSARFADHFWLLDRAPSTDADRRRAESYRAEQARTDAMTAAPSLAAFFDDLKLDIDIADAVLADTPRLAQMALRTNQFNATLERRDEAAFRRTLSDADSVTKTVSVKDRFGDYGVVGSISGRFVEGVLLVDLFTLSCRALGRGVEHTMLAAMGREAEARGAASLEVRYVIGPRNAPLLDFLEGLTGERPQTDGAVRFEACAAASVQFDPVRDFAGQDGDQNHQQPTPVAASKPAAANAVDRNVLFQRLAEELTTGATLLAAIKGAVRRRPEAAGPYIAPAPGLERLLTEIWADVLNFDRIGVGDRFQDLGGKSIHLARIFAALPEEIRERLSLADLFRFGTIKALSEHLSDDGSTVDAVSDRAAKMRSARMRPAPARRAARQRLEGERA